MKKCAFVIFLFSVFAMACNSKTENSTIEGSPMPDEIEYDSLYAKKLDADEYGMHQYVMAFLKRGPNGDLPKEESVELQRAHLDNIGKLAEAGKLVLAGPFLDDGDLRGIYIFDVKTVKEAKKLTATDPAIQKGSLIMDLHPWYGSAAIMEINEIHKRIAKIEI